MRGEVIPVIELARLRFEKARKKHALATLGGNPEAILAADTAERAALAEYVRLGIELKGEPPRNSCDDEPHSWFR